MAFSPTKLKAPIFEAENRENHPGSGKPGLIVLAALRQATYASLALLCVCAATACRCSSHSEPAKGREICTGVQQIPQPQRIGSDLYVEAKGTLSNARGDGVVTWLSVWRKPGFGEFRVPGGRRAFAAYDLVIQSSDFDTTL